MSQQATSADEGKKTAKYWYLLFSSGLTGIAAGLWLLLLPELTMQLAVLLLALVFLVSGMLEISFGILNRNQLSHWGWALVSGLITLFFGAVLSTDPRFSTAGFAIFMGFALFMRSVHTVGVSVVLFMYKIKSWRNNFIIGSVGSLASTFVIFIPFLDGVSAMFWTSIALIATGTSIIYLSFKLR